ncbi:MAG: hypothetical protein ACRECW_19205 [Phyllobacterium sp.]
MTLANGRLPVVVLLALALASCGTSDKNQQPAFVSSALENGVSTTKAFPVGDKQHFIEFRSRYALSYGHSYVIFGRVNKAGAMVNPEVAGLAPASTSTTPYVMGHFVPVPAETGWSDGDLEEAYRSASWRIMLTDAEYKEVVASIRKLQASSPVWHASLYNCNAFVADIARSMGYKAPGIWLRPQQFITKLREMNGG